MKSGLTRREALKSDAAIATLGAGARLDLPSNAFGNSDEHGKDTECAKDVEYLPVTLQQVPEPKNINFTVSYPGKPSLKLAAHYWYNAAALAAGRKCPAIVELNPYRRRDGLKYSDSMMYPWFAANEYLCFRVDLEGSGDSEGVMADEYTNELLSCRRPYSAAMGLRSPVNLAVSRQCEVELIAKPLLRYTHQQRHPKIALGL